MRKLSHNDTISIGYKTIQNRHEPLIRYLTHERNETNKIQVSPFQLHTLRFCCFQLWAYL